MRPIFFLLVSHVYCYWIYERCLVVVPSPRTLMKIVCDCFHACKLLLCGDTELNPGPTVEEMLQSLLAGQQAIRGDLAEVKERLSKTEKAVQDFNVKLIKLEDNVRELTVKMNSFESLGGDVISVHDALKQCQEKIVELEDRSRRSNLIVFAIPEAPGETEEQLRHKVIQEVFKDKLRIDCKSVGRIHRLGKSSQNRPVILYFQDCLEKQAVLRNKIKLKGTDIFVDNDYSSETLRKRKLLWESAKAARDGGKKVFLVSDKLCVDKRYYVWDDGTKSRTPLQKINAEPTA